jgi:hypothetical protein
VTSYVESSIEQSKVRAAKCNDGFNQASTEKGVGTPRMGSLDVLRGLFVHNSLLVKYEN